MTVNELIAELRVLAAQGYGELDVAVYDSEYSEFNVDSVNPQKLNALKRNKETYVLNELSQLRGIDFISLNY